MQPRWWQGEQLLSSFCTIVEQAGSTACGLLLKTENKPIKFYHIQWCMSTRCTFPVKHYGVCKREKAVSEFCLFVMPFFAIR